MSSPIKPSTSANALPNARASKQAVKGRKPEDDFQDTLRDGDAAEVNSTVATGQPVELASAAAVEPGQGTEGNAPASADQHNGVDPSFEKGVDGKDLDPAVLLEKEPPAVGPALGVPAWGWVAGGAGAAAAASGGGGGGDNNQATASTVPATPNARLNVDSGLSQADGVTTNAAIVAPTNLAQGAKLEYKVDDGAWVADYVAPTKDGQHTVQIRQTVNGVTSEVQTIELTLDNVAPEALTVALKTDSGVSSSDAITNSAELVVTGAETGALIEYSLDGGTTWSSTLAAKDGLNSVVVRQTDLAGNVSAASEALTFTLDTQASGIPQAQVSKGTLISGAASEAATVYVQDIAFLSFAAVGQVGVTRTYSVDGAAPAKAYLAPKGEGPHTITVSDTDVAGNVASKTFNVTVDSTPPAAPSLGLQSDTGASSTDLTSQIGLLRVGSENSATVEYSINGGKTWSTSFTAVEGLNNVVARQTDLAGNVSPVSAVFSFTKDTTAPSAPVPSLVQDTGASNGDGNTQNGAIDAHAESKATVEYSVDGGKTWSTNFSAAEGSNSVLVRQTDLAGNQSAASSAFVFTKDTVLPPVLSINPVGDAYVNAKEQASFGYTIGNLGTEPSSTTIVVTFTDSKNSKVTSTAVAGSGTVNLSGLAEGAISVSYVASDLAGNQSTGSGASLTLDRTLSTPSVSLAVDSFGAGTTGTSADHLTNDASALKMSVPSESVTRVFSVDGKTATTTYLAPTTNGDHTVVVTDTDLAGNVAVGETLSFTLDKSAPQAPTLALKTNSGSMSDDITNVSDLNYGTLEAGAAIEFSTDDGKTWHANFAPSEGAVKVVAHQIDKAGNVSANSAALNFTYDKTAPAKLEVKLQNDTGSSQTDGKTSDVMLDFGSTKESGSTLSYSVDGGAWSSTYAPLDGAHTLQVRQIDVAGNVSADSAILTFTKDTQAPQSFSVKVDGDNLVNRNEQLGLGFTVSALEAGAQATVTFKDSLGTTYTQSVVNTGTSVADIKGTAVLTSLADGKITVSVTAKDVAGNPATVAGSDLTLDGIATPTITLVDTFGAGTTGTDHDGWTNNANLKFSDVPSDIATRVFTITDGKTTTSSSAYAVPTASGHYTVTVTDTDKSGNVASASITFDLDTAAPAAPTISLKTDSGIKDGITNVSDIAPGTLENGAAIEYSLDGGKTWSSTVPASLKDGDISVIARQIDKVGNVSANSAAVNFKLDTTAPTQLDVKLAAGTDTGSSGTDRITKTVTLDLGANKEAGSTLQYSLDGSATWGNTFDAPEGQHTVQVRQIDAAGNVSAASTALPFTKDTTPPAAATLSVQNGDSYINANERAGLSFTVGQLEAGATAAVTFTSGSGSVTKTVTNTGVSLGSVTDQVNLGTLADGTVTISMVVTDVAGNTTAVTGLPTYTLDTVVPSPTFKLANDTAGAGTTGTTSDTRTYDASLSDIAKPADLATRTFKVDSNDAAAAYVAPSTDGAHTVVVTDTDKAGNSASYTLNFTLDKTPPPAMTLTAGNGDSYINKSEAATSVSYNLAFATAEDASTVVAVTFVDKNGVSVNGGASGQVNLSGMADGLITVSYKATDIAGNVRTGTTSLTLDTLIQKPTVGLGSDTYGVGTSGTNLDAISKDVSSLNVSAMTEAGQRTYAVDGGAASTSYAAPTSEGVHTVVVTDTDLAGNTASTSLSFTLDKTPPPEMTLTVGGNGDAYIGKSEAASPISYSLAFKSTEAASTVVAVTFMDKNGVTVTGGSAGTANLSGMADGLITVSYTATDVAGNVRTGSSALTLDRAIDTPVITLTTDTYGIGNDSYKTDRLTSVADITVSAKAADVTRTYSVDGGAASATYTAPTTNGAHTVKVTDTDLSGNTASATLGFTLDKTAPTALNIVALDSGASDDRTNIAAPAIVSGQEAGTALQYNLDGQGWSTTYAPVDGAHKVKVRQVDAAGNASADSNEVNFTLDTTAPAAVSVVVDGVDAGGFRWINHAAQPHVAFTASNLTEADVVTYITFTGVNSGGAVSQTVSTTAAQLGKGTVDLSSFDDGLVSVTVRSVDGAGNAKAGTATTNLKLDGIATPTIGLLEDTGSAQWIGEGSFHDLISSKAGINVSTAPSDLVSRVYALSSDGGKTYVESTTKPLPVKDGTYIVRVTDTDQAQNVASASLTYTLDTTIVKPVIGLNYDSGYDQGASLTDLYTNQGWVGAKNQESDAYLSFSIDGGTTWQTTFHAVEGGNSVMIRQTDGAGNTAISDVLNFTLDTQISKPTLTLSTTTVDDSNKSALTYTVDTPDTDIVNSWVTFTDSQGHQIGQSGGTANLSGLSDGAVTAVLHTQDKAGNVADSSAVTLQLHTFSYKDIVSASGNQVVLQFSKAIDANHLPLPENFRLWMTDVNYNVVLGNGHAVAVTNVAVSSTDSSQLVLTLGQPLSTTGTLQVAYSDYNHNDLVSHHLTSTEGSEASWFDDATKVSVEPTITAIRSSHEPQFDLTASEPGATLDLQVYFSEPVKFTKALDGSTPTLTVTVQAADGSKTNLTAVFSPWGNFDYDTHTLSSASFIVQLSDNPDVTGSWSVTSFNLNGATVAAGQPYSNLGDLPLNTSLANAVPDFAANAWLVGSNLVDLSATNGVLNHSTGSTNEILFWDKPGALPTNLYANVKAGAGTRDAMVVPIVLTTAMTDADALAYHVLYNDSTKVVNVYKEGVATPVQSIAVPQGSNWPSGVEVLYFSLMYKDKSTGEIIEVNDGDEGVLLASKPLAYEDAQRTGDVFIQATGGTDNIDLATSNSVTLASGAKHTFNATDRIVIQTSSGNDVVVGSKGNDTVVLGDGNKTISAGAGNDAFMIHSWDYGNTTLDGGIGQDSLKLQLSGSQPFMKADAAGTVYLAGIHVDYGTTPATLSFDSPEYWFAFDESLGSLKVGTPGKGALGTGNFVVNGVEVVTVNMEDSDQSVTAGLQIGTSSNDVLTSNGSGSVVFGGKGNDVLKAMGDHDVLIGGTGDDTLVVNANNNGMISGGDGVDTAVVLAGVWGPLVAKASDTPNSWFIVNANDQNGPPYFKLVKDTSTGAFTLNTLPAADGYSGSTVGALGDVLVNTTLAGVESLKITSPDGQTLGVFDLNNPTADVGASLASDGKTISVSFSSTTLDATVGKLPTADAFTVEVKSDSGRTKLIEVTGVSIANNKVVLSLGDVFEGGHLFVHYADPSKASDAKALHVASTGADIASFSVDAYVPGAAPKITAITNEDPADLAPFAGSDDSMPLYVHFNSKVSVTAAGNGSLPTLAVTVTAPDGSTHVLNARLINDPSHDSSIVKTDVLHFEVPLGASDMGTLAITATSLTLNGATVTQFLGSTPADVSIGASVSLPPVMSNNVLFGGNVAKNPASYAGTTGNDAVFLSTDQNTKALTGDFSSISGGASGSRDSIFVGIVLPDTVTDYRSATQYELRYNGSGSTKYVEVWQAGGSTPVQQVALPDSLHWPQGVDVLEYGVRYFDTASGSLEWADVVPMSFTQSTKAWGSGSDFTVHGSMDDDTIDLHSDAALTVSGAISGSSSHTVVKADHLLILGGAGNDAITGHDGVDVINAGAGSNSINAGAGDDLIFIDHGSANTIDGGADTDKVHFTLVGNDARGYVDAAGTLHLSGVYVDRATDTVISSLEQYTLNIDETTLGGTNKMTLTDVAHGNAVSTITNVEGLDFNFSASMQDHAKLPLLFGTSEANDLTVTGSDSFGFGGAGNDTLTARGDGVCLFGGSGDDTLKFGFDAQALISGGTGNDTGVMTIGSQLPTLTLSHDSTLVWSLQDVPGHTVFQFEADATHGGFAVKTASGSDLGYGTSCTTNGDMTISGVEKLFIQNSVGTIVAKLQLDDTNHTVAVLPV